MTTESILYDLYNKNITIFNIFFTSTTIDCHIHRSIKSIYQSITYNYVYLFDFPDLFKKLGLNELLMSYQKFVNNNPGISYLRVYIAISILLSGINSGLNHNADEFNILHGKIFENLYDKGYSQHTIEYELSIFSNLDKALRKMNPFVGNLCKCKQSDYYTGGCYRRFDLVEKIINEIKLNDFFYFANCMEKINKMSIEPIIKIYAQPIRSLDEPTIIKLLNYFQQVKSKNCVYIYNNRFITNHKIDYFQNEKIEIKCVSFPTHCFICEKFDYDRDYEFYSDGYVLNETKKDVVNFICKKCKKKIIKTLNLPEKSTSFGIFRLPNTTNYFEQRRFKPKLLIISNLFDVNSLFAGLPTDVIYHIILSIYWNPLNAIPDEDLYVNKSEEILFSQFRSVFGICS